MRLLVFAAIYQFGLECGVGAGKLSLFFKLIRIHDHVGVSESALRTQIQQMELLLPQFQAACEQQANTQKRKAVVAMDETFFGEFLILVLMDLSSGYLLLEDISDDRCYETWYAKTSPRLEALGIEVSHAISDRAKALIKLAVTGFECDSGADLFHAQQDLSRWLGPKLARQAATAEKQAIVAQTTEEKAPETANDAEKVEEGLENRAKAFEHLAGEQDISDKKEVMKKFRNPIKPLAVSVSFWWLWVSETLQSLAVDKDLEDWLTTALLPVVYWHQHLHKTQNSQARERYRKAWTH